MAILFSILLCLAVHWKAAVGQSLGGIAGLPEVRACGQEIGVFTADDILQAGRAYLETFVDDEFLENTLNVLFQAVNYDVKAVKICTSCRRETERILGNGGAVNGKFLTYCARDKVSFRAPQSSLLFLPIDPSTGEILKEVQLRPYVNMISSPGKLDLTPTIWWPNSLSDYVQEVRSGDASLSIFTRMMSDYLPGMVAASGGSISLFPDYRGYGESSLGLNQTIFQPESYVQPTVIGVLAMDDYLRSNTASCTAMNRRITIRGLGDGAFGVPFVSDALRRFGIQTIQAFVGAGPLDLETFLMNTFEAFDESSVSSSNPLVSILPHTAFTYSSDVEGNVFQGPRLLANQYVNEVSIWYRAPSPFSYAQVSFLVPPDVRQLVNQDFVALMQQGFDNGNPSPCSSVGDTNPLNELCDAVLEASALPILRDGRLPFKVEICYSQDDEVYSPSNYPGDLFASNQITRYQGPFGFPNLRPFNADHDVALRLCTVSPLLYFGLERHVPEVLEDRANYLTPMSAEQLAVCRGETLPSGGDGTDDGGSGGGGGGGGQNGPDNSAARLGRPAWMTTVALAASYILVVV